MNELIETIFANFKVDNVDIPVSFLRYDGNKTTYVIYQAINVNETLDGDDELQAYVEYYDFDIFSKGNYFGIINGLKEILQNNGFKWQPSMSSGDLYEDDTGYYHKTLCFSYIRSETRNEIQSL